MSPILGRRYVLFGGAFAREALKSRSMASSRVSASHCHACPALSPLSQPNPTTTPASLFPPAALPLPRPCCPTHGPAPNWQLLLEELVIFHDPSERAPSALHRKPCPFVACNNAQKQLQSVAFDITCSNVDDKIIITY